MKTYLSGANGIAEALKKGRGILKVSRRSGRGAELIAMAEKHGVPVRDVDAKELSSLNPDHRGFLLETRGGASPSVRSLEELFPRTDDNSLIILLDGVTDPGNLGAVLRSADQFGADAVVVPRRRSAGSDANTLSRSSSGAVEWVPLIDVSNMARALSQLKDQGYWIWGADMEGSPAPQVNLKGRTALVMGREGQGLHRLIREQCDGLIRIPTSGKVDSLNVSTAAGILMYECRRQQGFEY
ncbi:MAG: 23S rRNA (guanosine(2251)-2'-O)-methyltransferase RlmB [Spirochaetales bacterium]|nr:23S rRNA (guanosine(2251)-2'-O)-methyltransferase RlmB [Spirochaetales bacterium]